MGPMRLTALCHARSQSALFDDQAGSGYAPVRELLDQGGQPTSSSLFVQVP